MTAQDDTPAQQRKRGNPRKKHRRRWGRIRQLPSGRYQARYPGPDGQTYPAPYTFENKTDAQHWLTDKEADLRRNGWHDPNAGLIPLGPYAEKWIKQRAGLATRTVEKYEGYLRLHIAPVLGSTYVADITTPVVRAWRTERLSELAPKGGPTVAGSYRFLRAVLNTAVEDGLIARNPCRIKGADKDNSPERPTATIEEVYAIADAIKEWWRCLVLLAAFGSLRWGELIALRRRHLDLENGIVDVKARLAETGGSFERGRPKGGEGSRLVVIPPAIVPELRAHLAKWSEPGRNGRVFVGPKGVTPMRSNFNRYWKKALDGAGIEVDPELGLHLHDLRHTGNDLRSPGASLKDLMAHMGHTTERAALIYQHANIARQQAMAKLVSDAIEEVRASGGPDANGHVGGTQVNTDDDDNGAGAHEQSA